VLEAAGVEPDSVEVLLTGADRGIQGEVEHDYARSLPVAEATRPEVLLAYAMNGQPLLPQHGFPLRVIVPGWYGMTHVKWLTRITLLDEPFTGFQQAQTYRFQVDEDDPGTPTTRIRPRSLAIPPGIPDFLTRRRVVDAGPCELRGRAWSGHGLVVRVAVSVDGGEHWADAELGPQPSPYAWRSWGFDWDAVPGEHVICTRATDAAGNVQPLEPQWNLLGMENNGAQRIPVEVRG
jgi:DMSO/TMAO reductase YedYZ molybdopterin-dependent catalytic subunit